MEETSAVLAFVRSFLSTIMAMPGSQFIVGHILFNFVLAVAAAMREGRFEAAKLADFTKDKLPLVLVYYASSLLVTLWPNVLGIDYVPGAVLALVTASLGGDTIDSLARLGVPIPDKLRRFAKQEKGGGVVTLRGSVIRYGKTE